MKIAIIGGGISGLICALMLEKKGYSPTIFEKNSAVGGVFNSFFKKNILFDIGFHYSGSLAKGQYLDTMFEYYNLKDKLKLSEYDFAFDSIYIDGEIFHIPNNSIAFKEMLKKDFPQEKSTIEKFFLECQNSSAISADAPADHRSLEEVMIDFKDIKLKKILQHFTLFFSKQQHKKASFDLYAKMMISMLDGTRKIEGGGKAVVDAIKNSLKKSTIKTKSEIVKFILEEKTIKALKYNNKIEKYDSYISTIHPKTLSKLITSENRSINRYFKHIKSLEETPSVFAIFCLIEKDIKNNLYFYGKECFSVLPSRKYDGKTVATILIESDYNIYANLDKSTYKEKKVKECNKYIKKLKKLADFGDIEVIDISTPLTKQRYSNGYNGSLYGVLCSNKQKRLSMLMSKSRFDNLYLAGENIIAPGLLGCWLGSEMATNYFKEVA